MAKKKTNYISYELKKLDLYIGQMNDFLDKNPPNLATDRLERIQTQRGEIIRVIASIETQVKCFMDNLEKLPKLLEDLNRLRKEVDNDKKELEIRGGANRPGFMDDDVDEEEEEEEEVKPKKKSNTKKPPQQAESAFDDDEYFEGSETEEEIVEPQSDFKLLPPPDEEDQGDDEWLTDMEEF